MRPAIHRGVVGRKDGVAPVRLAGAVTAEALQLAGPWRRRPAGGAALHGHRSHASPRQASLLVGADETEAWRSMSTWTAGMSVSSSVWTTEDTRSWRHAGRRWAGRPQR